MEIIFVAGLDPLLAQGHASHVRHLVQELEARGHSVDVLARDTGGSLCWEGRGRFARIKRVPIPILGQLLVEIVTAFRLRQWIRKSRPDVVMARSEVLAFAVLATPAHVPVVIESNASVVQHQARQFRFRTWSIRWIEKRLFRRARRIGVVAPSLLETHLEHHSVERDRFFVVRNGAPISPLPTLDDIRLARARGGARDSDFVIALSGSASSRIEFRWLVSALEQNRSVRLWVMGQGELWRDWQQVALSSDARDRIVFLGALSEEEATRFVQSAQAVVAPYADGRIEYLGGDPLKVLHGMASGRPLLASGLPEDPPFDRIGAGQRVAGNVGAWNRAIRDLLDEWERAGAPLWQWPYSGEGPGRVWIKENRTWAQTAAIWEQELRRVVNEDAGTGHSLSR